MHAYRWPCLKNERKICFKIQVWKELTSGYNLGWEKLDGGLSGLLARTIRHSCNFHTERLLSSDVLHDEPRTVRSLTADCPPLTSPFYVESSRLWVGCLLERRTVRTSVADCPPVNFRLEQRLWCLWWVSWMNGGQSGPSAADCPRIWKRSALTRFDLTYSRWVWTADCPAS
jgi:hypothetical protein